MQQTITHIYPIAASRYWQELYFDKHFTEQLYLQGLGCLHFQLLAEGTFPDYSRTIRSQPKLMVPKTLQKILGPSLSYTEKGQLTLAENRYSFSITPSALANKIHISGTQCIRPTQENQTESTITIDFSVRMFGIGKIVEKFILQSTIENQQNAALFTKKWLSTKT